MKTTGLFWMGLLCTPLISPLQAADPTTGPRTSSVYPALTQLSLGDHAAKPGAFSFEPFQGSLFSGHPAPPPLTESIFPGIQNPNNPFGVRHPRTATYDSSFNFGQSKAKLYFLSLSGNSSLGLDSRQTVKRAEQINAAQMKDFQHRFEIHLAHPTSKSAPVLYPTPVQRAEDKLK